MGAGGSMAIARRMATLAASVILVMGNLASLSHSNAAGGDHKCAGGFATIVGTPGDDVLRGTKFQDWIVGLGGNDILIGKGGEDSLCGGSGDDVLRGKAGPDRLRGGDGDDRLYGGQRPDSLVGEAGDDKLVGGTHSSKAGDYAGYFESPSAVRVNLTRGTARGDGFDRLLGIENAQGSQNHSNVLIGDRGPNVFLAGSGDDSISGRGGADRIYGDNGRDTIIGGAGDDDLNGNDQNDTIEGNSGDDFLRGGLGAADILDGGVGTDTCTDGESVSNCEL
jgi:Ca2+-binding RTX toxin-like protein